MSYLRTTVTVLLAFALHIGSTAFVHVGWIPQPLVLLTVLAIWLDRPSGISRALLPAGLLVDIIQPVHFPFTTSAILAAWIASAAIQRQWLTNHSLASLFGLAVFGVTVGAATTGVLLWFTASTGMSATPIHDTWSLGGLLKRLGIEVVLTLIAGYLSRTSLQFLRTRFLYAPR